MRKSRIILFSISVLFILSLFLLYERYAAVQKDLSLIRDGQALKERVLGKYMSLIAEKPDLDKRVAALRKMRETEDAKLMEGQTASIVSAGLQDTIRSIVTSHGGSVLSERAGKAEDFGDFKTITVTVDTLLPDARGLADILYAIETHTPYLLVKDLDVRVRNFKIPKELSVKFDVSGLTSTGQ